MAEFSNYLEEQILTHLLRTGTWTKPSVVAIALCNASIDDTMDGTSIPEIASTGAYARVALNPDDTNWSDPSTGTQGESDNSLAITFTTASADWGAVTHVALVDSTVYAEGNVFGYTALDATKQIDNGDTFEFNIGDLNVQVD